MTPFFILHADKLKSANRLRVAAKHNLREISSEVYEGGRIDPERIGLNRVLIGPTTSQGVMDLHKQLFAEAQVGKIKKDGSRTKVRDDAVIAIEFMVSIPPGVVEDEDRFFAEVPAWIKQRYGVPVLSATVHRDEAKPHMHCLVLPVKDGCLVGSGLIGVYADMHADFHRVVAAKHGLSRKVRLNAATRKAATPVVVAALDATPSLMQTTEFRAWLQGAVERDPQPLMELVGVPTDRSPAKQWIEIMTQPVPARQEKSYIGFVASRTGQPDEDQSFTCVRDCSFPLTQEAPADVAADLPKPIIMELAAVVREHNTDLSELPERVVLRETELPANYWNPETGEYVLPPPPPPSAREQAMSEIRAILRMRDDRQEDSVPKAARVDRTMK
jgi:hypothetical protein